MERVRTPQQLTMRRGMYVLPSVFTAVNIAAGFFAITQSLQGSVADPTHFDYAAIAILFAIPFDAIDGRIARMTNTASDFGKELDSLADVITFGVAPSVLAYSWGFRMLPELARTDLRHQLLQLGAIACFLFLICGACRLARFNISKNPVPRNPGRPDRKYFVGMPIPAGAGVLAACIHYFNGIPITVWWFSVAWMGLVLLTGFLMVSTWRFWSGKEISLVDRRPFRLVVLMAAVIALLVLFSEYVLVIVALGYLCSGLLARIGYAWQRRLGRNRRHARGEVIP